MLNTIKVGLQDSKRLKQLNTRTMHIVCYKCTLLYTLAHTSCIVKAASDFAAAPRGRPLPVWPLALLIH